MIYRKRGAVVRYENGVIVRVIESGEAVEDGPLFRCAPVEAEPLAAPELPAIPNIAAERIIVTAGVAEHRYGDLAWREETLRVHAALVKGRMRVLVDRMEDLAPLADALARAEEQQREAPPRLVLAPNVTARRLESLAGLVDVRQSAGGRDGYGQLVEAGTRNFYRPSYRVRPLARAFNIRATPFGTIHPELPRAIAWLEPAGVLIEERGRVYPSRIRIERIAAVGEEAIWYPYGAGSFGAAMML
ncbi:MAG TPA: hypothetical protein VF698_04140 [Thermoanaerobaculia bacterium]|jgi:hypothetical protein